MGYYTNYIIETSEYDPHFFSILEFISSKLFEFINDTCCMTFFKWPSCREDIKKLSKIFPNLCIKVYSCGDSPEDIWIGFWKNGDQSFKRFNLNMLTPDLDFITKNNWKWTK